MFLFLGCLWLAAQPASATTATWTNIVAGTTVVDTWANASNWNAAQYPGQDAANQNAYLTNRVANAVYKAVVDASLPNQVGTVEIKNLGAGGEAWLVVTNTLFAATNLLIRNGGRVQIDSQGILTNLLGFTMDGTNGQLLVNSGGSLFTSNNGNIGFGSGGKSNVLTLGDSALLAVTNGYLMLGNGVGNDGNRLLVTNNNVSIRTTATSAIGSGSANNLALFTGSNVVWDLGGNVQIRVGQNGTARSNTLMVAGGSLSLLGGTLNIGLNAGSFGNMLIVTNGAKFYTIRTALAGYATSNNLILVTGAGSQWDCGGSQQKSGDSGGCNNSFVVDNNGTVSNASIYVGSQTSLSSSNSLLLANGAKWWEGSGTDSMIGYGGISNSATVTGSGTLWNLGTRTLYVGGSTSNNTLSSLQIDAGAMITNGALSLGAGGKSSQNTAAITRGGKFVASGTSVIGTSSTNNLVVITGSGSLWNGNVQALTVGNNAAAYGNAMRIEDDALVTNVNGLTVGGNGACSNCLTVTGGGRCYLSSGASYAVGSTGATNNFTLVSGSGSALSCAGNLANGNIYVGIISATGNVLVVDSGASCLGWNQIYVGRYSNCVDNALIITNGGYVQCSLMRIAHQGSNTWNNMLQVMDGGMLETGQNGLQVDQAPTGVVGNNCITNHGGIYQFTYAAPNIYPSPGSGSYIYLTDGTISFRGVTTVDVKGNRSGNLTNIQFNGSNAFRLNSATNATSPDQSYTFTDTLGPTNYARLELFNGAMYRGGSVTIGSGGTLALSGTPSTITNLTITSGGTLEATVSSTNSASLLNAVGSVTLGGALRLILAAPPPPAGFDWTLINKSGAVGMTGQFDGGSTFKQAYLGTNYTFRITTTGGDGNDLVLSSMGKSMTGTTLLVY
jgi:fibronectin-binding autotransporter adhesin